jgi:hypothetical protein
MKQCRRIYYSDAQRTAILGRWKRSETMNAIGQLCDRGHSSVYSVLKPTGGIRPSFRKHSPTALTLY